jgi:hypothetical protein
MITVKGTLIVGVTVDGTEHVDFELRPRLVSDSVEAAEDERAQGNPSYEGLVVTAKQLVKLGTLKPDQITPELLMGMHDIDMQEILVKSKELEARLRRFRSEREKSAQAAGGSVEGGVPAS